MSAAEARRTHEGPAAFEGFAVETHDGLVFSVKGLLHPPGRWTAYLRYVAEPGGERERGGRRYRKVSTFAEQLAVLEPRGDAYLSFDDAAGRVLQGVPAEAAARVLDPRRRLGELAAGGPADALEEAALELAALLARAAGVPPAALGVTGSLLPGLHVASSDLDLVVYGAEPSRAVHRALRRLFTERGGPVAWPDDEALAAIHAGHRCETPLTAADFARQQAAKVNEGSFRGTGFFVRFVPLPSEAGERYGDVRYAPAGAATLEARVVDASEAIFTPCRYLVEDVRLLPAADAEARTVREIVSFRGRFADQARAGERVRARGTLERATPRAGAPFARLVVGARGDYLLSLPT